MDEINKLTKFHDFILWESQSRDTIDVKKIYIDICGDLVAGILLSQIIYWYLPTQEGKSKLRVYKVNSEGKQVAWIAKKRHEWWDEIRISPKQVDRAIKKLKTKGIIEMKVHRFNGTPTPHIRILKKNLLRLLNNEIYNKKSNPFLPKGESPYSLNGEIDIDQRDKCLTETISKNTTKNKKKEIRSCFKKPDVSAFPFSFMDINKYQFDKNKQQYFFYIPLPDQISCCDSPEFNQQDILDCIDRLDVLKEMIHCPYCHNIYKPLYFLYKRMKELKENEIAYQMIGNRIYINIDQLSA